MVTLKDSILPPNVLFREFESGRMSREDFHSAMSFHAEELIEEMEEQRRNPLEAFVESIRNRRFAHSLARKHGEAAVREIFTALADVAGFPPARLLWNAGHRHVPLYCFLRLGCEPLFRVRSLEVKKRSARIDLEYQFDGARRLTREMFSFKRGWHGNLYLEDRIIFPRK
ncbi:MAG: hypothetical protein ACJ0K4_12950 [Verrucomicrobiales bacterium]|nr:MAG: hypothetical protein EVB09_09180 [Verrucomicrobiaceae bacterium]